MTAELVIRDGDPHWWTSPDIWVVPGSDPNGTPGSPIAGQTSYLWGRVENRGDQAVSAARVDFYWSNPATGVFRSNSNFVGSAFVDLAAGEAKEVLCVNPWVPVVVNSGHECVVAEVIHSADPLPTPPPDAFDPPTYRQIAQKNLTVLQASRSSMVRAIQLVAPRRQPRRLLLQVEIGGDLDRVNLAQLGLEGFRAADEPDVRAQLALDSGCDFDPVAGEGRELEVQLPAARSQAIYLKVPPQSLEPRTYVLLHVVAREDERVIGGMTYILVPAEKAQEKEY